MTKAERAAYNREWYRKNPAKCRFYNDRWKTNNPEKTKAIKRRYYRKNVLTLRQKIRKWELRNLYGISMEDYHRMLVAQDGRCAICGIAITSERSLDVDHNHTTKIVRGLLCTHCNRKIASIEDREWLKLGIQYLEKYV